MTALADVRNTPKFESEIFLSFPVKGSTKIYKGSLVVLDAGYAAPGSTALGLVAIGRAKSTVDNSSGSDGDLTIEVEPGTFRWANGSSIAQADVGSMAYVVDDQTVSTTASGKSPAGLIVSVDANGVYVKTAPTADSLVALSSTAGAALAASGAVGTSPLAARADHVHPKNTQTGSLTLVSGTKTISSGIVITANSKVFLQMSAPGAGALGDHYKVTGLTVGGAGVGAFTVTAIKSSDATTITTDISVHDFLIVD